MDDHGTEVSAVLKDSNYTDCRNLGQGMATNGLTSIYYTIY